MLCCFYASGCSLQGIWGTDTLRFRTSSSPQVLTVLSMFPQAVRLGLLVEYEFACVSVVRIAFVCLTRRLTLNHNGAMSTQTMHGLAQALVGSGKQREITAPYNILIWVLSAN